MDYTLYTIEDYLTDDSFINYCLETDKNDILFWNNLIVEYPEIAVKIKEAKALFFLLAIKVNPLDKEQELLKLKTSIDPAPVKTKVTISRFAWYAVAASILLFIGIYAVISRKDYSVDLPVLEKQHQMVEIKTGYQERRTVKLADGSVVTLNGLTTLKVDQDYNSNNRVLWLSGEANFDVARNKDKPFIVISGKTATTALGTSFKIRNYTGGKEATVMLTTGKVNIGTVEGERVTNHFSILPGEMITAQATGGFIKAAFNIQEVEDWKNRKIIFSRASMTEIKSVLYKIYGVEIQTVGEPKKMIAFTGEFTNENLSDVLAAIGFSNHFTYTIKENKVELIF
jgi:transmembrane sensor